MKYFLLIAATLVLTTCIIPIDLNPEDPDNILIVDGFITNEQGPFEVVISRLSKFAGTLQGGREFFEADATVFITDQNGVKTDLTKADLTRREVINTCDPPGCCPGVFFFPVESLGYRTPESFSGQIGSTYVLTVITQNGRTYESTPQTLKVSPKIDSVSYQFRQLPSIDNVTSSSGVDIIASWQDPSESDDFYSWRVNGVYKIETPITEFTAGVCCLYDPADNGSTLCWINEKDIDGNEEAFSDAQANGAAITRRVGFIQDDGLRFANVNGSPDKQYYVEVEQMALSGEAFAFNKLLKSLGEIDGDIFDPPPAELRGNMSNVNDPDEKVIGFFGAHSIQRNGTFIKRSDLDFIQRFPHPCGDCRTRAGAVVETPEIFR